MVAPVTRFSGQALSEIRSITALGKGGFIPIKPNEDNDVLQRIPLSTRPGWSNARSYQSLFLIPVSRTLLEREHHVRHWLEETDFENLLVAMKEYRKCLYQYAKPELTRGDWSVQSSPANDDQPSTHRGGHSTSGTTAPHRPSRPQFPITPGHPAWNELRYRDF
jgi:hypothetical protein